MPHRGSGSADADDPTGTADPDRSTADPPRTVAAAPTSRAGGTSPAESSAVPTPVTTSTDGSAGAPSSTVRYRYTEAIREHVLVPSTIDGDNDGKPDLMSVDVIRPKTPPGERVPVILEASPYYFTVGRGAEYQRKRLGPDGVVVSMPLAYDNYFVPRGYAFVAMDTPGTGRSAGCMDVVGPQDVAGTTAVINYLAARPWSSGKIGMIGKSYDASVANAVAAGGNPRLTTVVDISGISAMYGYARFGGIPRSPQWAGWYADTVNSPAAKKACAGFNRQMDLQSDDESGNDNAFWQARDYVKPERWRASTLIVHGLRDDNVTLDQATNLWTALRGKPDVAMWLHQYGHVDPFDADRQWWLGQLHRWFDHYLLGLNTGIDREPPVLVQRADLRGWDAATDWPRGSKATSLRLGEPATEGGLAADPAPAAPVTIDPDAQPDEGDVIAVPTRPRPYRAAFLTAKLTQPLSLSGTPTVDLTVATPAARGQVAVFLVDYGQADRLTVQDEHGGLVLGRKRTCSGESGPQDSACYLEPADPMRPTPYGVISRGWLDLGHRSSFQKVDPQAPTRPTTVTISMLPVDVTIPAGRTLGLVIAAGNPDRVVPGSDQAALRLDPTGSVLQLPHR